MKRTTTILLAVFLSLLAVVVLIQVWPRRGAGPDLKVRGWGTGAKVEKSEEEAPIDRITIAIGAERVTIRRADKGRWDFESPAGARADRYKVRQILDAFRDGLTSVVASRAEPKDLVAFGLDDANRISLTLANGDAVVAAIEVGSVQKPEEGYADGDTFVREPGSDRVYRLIGQDLRRPFEGGLKGLRDRRVFDWESADVASITIQNPAAASEGDRLIVLRSDVKEKAEGSEPNEQKEPKKPEREWRFETPANLRAGNVKSYAATLASLYAQEYVDALPDGVEIGPNSARVEVGLADGRSFRLAVSGLKDESAYVQVEGVPGFVKVSKYTAESLVKRVSDLRDKTLFGVRADEVERVRIVDRGVKVEVQRSGSGWRAVTPENWPIGKAAMDTLLRDVETLSAKDILPAGSVSAEATGLSAAPVQVTVVTRDGATRTLRIGREQEKGTFYAALSGSDEVFTIAEWMAKKVRKGPKDLRNRLLFDFKAEQVRAIEILHADETLRLERVEGEGNRFKATAPSEAGDLKEDPVRTLVGTLAGLNVKDFAEGKTLASVGLTGKPKTEVVVTLSDGSRHVLRVSDQTSNGDPYAASPTEPGFQNQVFTLNQYQVRNFAKHLAELR